MTRLVSENANNLIYIKIEGGNTDRQNKQKAKHTLTQLEGGGLSSPWNETKGDGLIEALMSQGEIDILLDDRENSDKPKHEVVITDLEDLKLREVENMEHLMEPEPELENLMVESEEDNTRLKHKELKSDVKAKATGKRSTDDEDVIAITETYPEL